MIHPTTRVLQQEAGYEPVGGISEAFPVWTGNSTEMTDISVEEPRETILVKLVNGVEVKCSPSQGFKILGGCVKAKDLTKSHWVRLTDSTYEFDYINLECYNYLNKLNSEELGVLVGLTQNIGMKEPDLPIVRRETYKELDRLLLKMRVPHIKEEYYKRTDRYKYDLSESFVKELLDFTGFPEQFWKSKLALRGYLKGLFTFCYIGNEMFVLRGIKSSNFLKEIQQALLLFGINSSYTNGLRMSQLIIFKHNCYRFSNDIGIFNAEDLFQGVDFMQFVKYKDKTINHTRYSRFYSMEDVEEGQLVGLDVNQYMTNGAILINT